MKGLATPDEDSRGHHADLRNLPTLQLGVVPLGGSLKSLYISDERRGASTASGSGSGSGRLRGGHATSTTTSTTTTTATTPSGEGSYTDVSSTLVSRKGKEKSLSDSESSIDSSQERISPPRRRREDSGETLSTARANSSYGGSDTESMAPSELPSVVSSGNSYSAEMYDQITPLRDPYTPSTSKRRSVPTMGPLYEVASVPVVTGKYSGEVETTDPAGPIPSGGAGSNTYQHGVGTLGFGDRDRAQNQDQDQQPLPSPNRPMMSPSMGLSEILAQPSYRETRAQSPYERHQPSPRSIMSDNTPREIDYFNLPVTYREGSLSAHLTAESAYAQSRRAQHGEDPPKPRSEPLPEESSISTPSWSSSDITSLTHSSSLKSPRIRNEGLLAPHGSFTSDSGRQYQARAKLKRAESLSKESTGSSESIGSWRGKTASGRTTDETGRKQVSETQYVQYVKEAMNGDQLALYHLGWSSDSGRDRHSLGDAELIWGGSVEPGSPSAFSSRSSITSRQSLRSDSTSYSRSQSILTGRSQVTEKGERPGPQADTEKSNLERVSSRRSSGEQSRRPPSQQEQPSNLPQSDRSARTRTTSAGSDLFADVAHMTLQSNARNNRTRETPPSTPAVSSSSTMRPSPSPFRRQTSYFDSQSLDPPLSTQGRKSTTASASSPFKSVDPLKDKVERPKDPIKERERKEERERRRAFRAEAARRAETASSTSESTMRIPTSREKSAGSGDGSGALPGSK